MLDRWRCPGCDALFSARELGRPELNHRHTQRCRVRWNAEHAAFVWPYPFSLRGAFVTGFNALDAYASNELSAKRVGVQVSVLMWRVSGAIHRTWCEARARYMSGVNR